MTNKTKILIVDDYNENIKALSEVIAKDDVEIYTATNAEDALELISSHEFGLALLDVQMPNITGFELAKIIRSVKRFRALPIIFVTAHREDSSFVFEGYQTGAVDLLFKPLDPNMVRAKVQMFVELAQQRALLQAHVTELEHLRVQAEAANLAKSQFLANMSHEIRTPLAAVMGFAELMSGSKVEQRDLIQYSSAVKRNGHLLMRLIDDILDLSKIEANKLELENVKFDLGELLHDVDATMSFRAREGSTNIVFKHPENFNYQFTSDPVRIKQVLINIIGNAIKFTPNGNVSVEVTCKPRANDPTQMKMTAIVSDDGIGLSPEQTARLFQPFTQADASTKRHFGGTGLGLVISRQIARAAGGEIRLLGSQIGKGSTFEIEMILQAEALGEVSENLNKEKDSDIIQGQGSLKGHRILAVDDSPDNLILLEHFLKESEVEIVFAENGLKAISEIMKNDFDLVLMDLQMPGMDGHETTMEVRKMKFTKPIIALTAHAIRSEHEKCKKAGCDSVLTKPISRTDLLDKLHYYLKGSVEANKDI